MKSGTFGFEILKNRVGVAVVTYAEGRITSFVISGRQLNR
jgi:hypothetical protein